MELIATCAFGLEKVLYQEIKKLGLWVVKTEDGKITFNGDHKEIMLTNLWLRTAERIYIKLNEFNANTFDQLFDQIFAMDWGEIIPQDATFPVLCSSTNSTLHHEPSIQSIVKKAIVKKLQLKRQQENLPETGASYSILIRINKDFCTIALDTTGESLHKRGYRLKSNITPIKETLAAAIILMSDWDINKILIDPFCGSGTIPIEAYLIAKNIPPGLNRTFTFQTWANYNHSEMIEILKKARSEILPIEPKIQASDIHLQSIEIAQENAKRANVVIHFEQKNFEHIEFHKIKNATIITNPPYGDRIGTEEIAEKISTNLGFFYNRTQNTSLFLITSQPNFQTLFGRKADKNRKLFNGKIKCYLYQYLPS